MEGSAASSHSSDLQDFREGPVGATGAGVAVRGVGDGWGAGGRGEGGGLRLFCPLARKTGEVVLAQLEVVVVVVMPAAQCWRWVQ